MVPLWTAVIHLDTQHCEPWEGWGGVCVLVLKVLPSESTEQSTFNYLHTLRLFTSRGAAWACNYRTMLEVESTGVFVVVIAVVSHLFALDVSRGLTLACFSRCLGNLSKTCTADGWTEMLPMAIALNCGYNMNSTNDDVSVMGYYLFEF